MDEQEELFLVYVNEIGIDIDGNYTYEFLFSSTPDVTWGEDWNIKPASICNNLIPEESTFHLVKKVKLKFKLALAQNNSCFSMQDCINGIIALAWEDIDDLTEDDEFPENLLVISYGTPLDDVEMMLSERGSYFSD